VGWGNGDNFAYKLLKTSREGALYSVGLHNGYVTIFVENGLIGLCIYLFWYISLLRASSRINNNSDKAYQFAFLTGVFTITLIQMILVDTQGVFLGNQAEYMHFCVCLAFLRGYDDIVKKQLNLTGGMK
jgi:O-antigen ligase